MRIDSTVASGNIPRIPAEQPEGVLFGFDTIAGEPIDSPFRQRTAMPGETQMHKALKKEACRWMYRNGYRAVAAEVKVSPLGIIDAVGTGVFRAYHNYLSVPHTQPQTVFIEAKASRGDFLRDCCADGMLTKALKAKREDLFNRGVVRRSRKLRGQAALGKFKSCLLTPMANLHYVIAPAGLIKKADLPPRWGLLTLGEGGVTVTVRADWVECANTSHVDCCIARTLTGDIHRADDRAIGSINRELFNQQMQLAERLASIKPQLLAQQEAAMVGSIEGISTDKPALPTNMFVDEPPTTPGATVASGRPAKRKLARPRKRREFV